MGFMTNNHGKDELVISSAFVHSLRERRARLTREIDERQKELLALTRQLEAVETLAPHLMASSAPEQPNLPQMEPEQKPEGSSSLVEAVLRAVRGSNRPIVPSQIRQQIERQGDGHLLSSQNYLYTAIKRVAERGDIIRANDGTYRLAPTSSPQGENPEASAPGS